mgnify:CR=1 FL=1
MIGEAIQNAHISGNGPFTKKVELLLGKQLGQSSKILLTTSCTHALEMSAILLSIRPGDEVLVPSFTFVSTVNAFVLRGAKIIFVDIRPDTMNIDETLIEDAITPKTRLLILNSPSNPTGAVYTPELIRGIVELAVEHDLWIISDEIYTELIWNESEHLAPASVDGGFERTLTVTGPSKTHAMTGWRVGILAAPTHVAKVVGRLQGNTCSHIPSFLMPAAEVAAMNWGAVAEFRDDYVRRRALMIGLIEAIPSISASDPEGAFYMMVDVRETGMDATTFATRAMDEALVQVIPLDSLPGGEGYIRLSYACEDHIIEEGLKRLANWLNSQ